MSYYQPPSRPGSPRPLRTLGLVLGAVLATVLLGFAFLVAATPQSVPGHAQLSLVQHSGTGQQVAAPLSTQAIANKVNPGLVNINTTLGYRGQQAAGTGMVLTPNGEVLTNNHVVAGATSIRATAVGNGRTYGATVIGYDRTRDVAVLKLDGASGLPTVPLGDSSRVAVGDSIVALGNAGGAGGTPVPAPGKVSALNQSVNALDESTGNTEQLSGLIQVSANIQSGDSGGALAGSTGRVIGMTTAAATGGPGGEGGGIGYAMPINQALSVARQIVSGAASETVHLGKSAFLGVAINDSVSGAVIQQVVAGGPAAHAGIAVGDTLTTFDGHAVDSASTLTGLMDRFHPGDKVGVGWLNQAGHERTATVTLAEGPVG
ncbi:PDZ domain-containing protein [Amycolatopsis rhizosphaerae]|uniref:PDZ domain-containing protein n=1 Tax=Amycolatopsis rhizosphaerae TaxID=2053003 RepID=A0A558ADZ1_9PSEU|nr:trypsin-like peptidase domain-containing protein [Amycolatopsis rhizosphaerae]TVT22482.1 PDZ domain-containing protein [Amycolatopsis rhizosphaerae]